MFYFTCDRSLSDRLVGSSVMRTRPHVDAATLAGDRVAADNATAWYNQREFIQTLFGITNSIVTWCTATE